MSRVYFHSPSGEAAIHGSERAWLGHVAAGPGTHAWDIHRSGGIDRALALVDLKADQPDGDYGANYLKTYAAEARAAKAANDAAWRAFEARRNAAREAGERVPAPMEGPVSDPEPGHRFVTAVQTALRVQGFEIEVAGHRLHTGDVGLNTALVAGSDAVALAAKIHGWCESHAFIEGADRAWLAGIVDDALDRGVYRRGLLYNDGPDKPKQWCTQGWEEVLDLLRARDDEPVVLSYSVCDQFPNQWIAQWVRPVLPDDWRPDWAQDGEGAAEWDGYDAARRTSAREEHQQDSWYDLPEATRWDLAMAGLRAGRPWARLAPDTLREVAFGPPVSVYDLYAADRDERVRRACARDLADAEAEAAAREAGVPA